MLLHKHDIEAVSREVRYLTLGNPSIPQATIKHGLTKLERRLFVIARLIRKVDSLRQRLASSHKNDTAMKTALKELETELQTAEEQIQ